MARPFSYRFEKTKNIIAFIFEYRCALCGNVNIRNHVHHLDFNRDNNNAFNFAVLCDYHHKVVHKGNIIFFPEMSPFQASELSKLNAFWSG